MTAIIGIGIKHDKKKEEIFSEINENCLKLNYLVVNDVEALPENVRGGIKAAKKTFKWDDTVVFTTNNEYPNSFDIDEEISESFVNKEKSIFIELIKQINIKLIENSEKVYYFFATEWFENDMVRYIEGDQNSLISMLKSQCNWKLYLYDIEHNFGICEEDYPLIFDVIH